MKAIPKTPASTEDNRRLAKPGLNDTTAAQGSNILKGGAAGSKPAGQGGGSVPGPARDLGDLNESDNRPGWEGSAPQADAASYTSAEDYMAFMDQTSAEHTAALQKDLEYRQLTPGAGINQGDNETQGAHNQQSDSDSNWRN